MNIIRIMALVKRNLTLTYRGIDPLIDIFYWPLFDLILWGFTSRGVASSETPHLVYVWLTGLVFWQGCVRSNLDLSLNFLLELWSKNVVNLFASPLSLAEWVVAALVLGCINTVTVVVFGSIMAYLFYGVNVLYFGWLLVPLFLLLMQSGWMLGSFTAGIIMYGGLKVQKIVWVLGWFFAPFSALFYALNVFPTWAYVIARALPMSYALEGLRSFAHTGIVPTQQLLISFTLNCVYMVAGMYFLVQMFYASRVYGLARLESE